MCHHHDKGVRGTGESAMEATDKISGMQIPGRSPSVVCEEQMEDTSHNNPW